MPILNMIQASSDLKRMDYISYAFRDGNMVFPLNRYVWWPNPAVNLKPMCQ